MRNQEAARYARWSAGIAAAIFLVVLGVYLRQREVRGSRTNNVPAVPRSVAQESAGFTFSKVVRAQKLFTVHASQATQYRAGNRSLLENVTINIYGAHGTRDDSVRAGECSYEPETGSIRCQGVVEIELRDAKARPGAAMQLETSDILFERDSGKVSTDKPVTLRFADGRGSADGILYDPQSENVTLNKNVRMEIEPAGRARTLPVKLSGGALEFRRKENLLELAGPVRAEQGGETLTAGKMELQLDRKMRPTRAVASGHPEIFANGMRGNGFVTAKRVEAEFTAAGVIQKLLAEGDVRGESRTSSRKSAETNFSAQQAEMILAAEDGANEPAEATMRGGVKFSAVEAGVRRNVSTEALRVEFAPVAAKKPGVRLAQAETLAEGKVVVSSPEARTRISAGKLLARFDDQNELTALRGSGGVEIARNESRGSLAQMSTAQSFAAEFAGGEWTTIDERGNVKFTEDARRGSADQAEFSRLTNEMTLEGAASVQNAEEQLHAARIRINEASGELQASHGVVASYFGKRAADASVALKTKAAQNFGADVNISADEMSGTGMSKTAPGNGHAIFSGRARMWESSGSLQANTIEFWQSEQRAEARGNVLGQFVEMGRESSLMSRKRQAKTAPVVWKVHAARADYWNDTGKMEWSGGVHALSSEGEISARNLELLFAKSADGRQSLRRAIALGGVRIEQNGRVGTAERGDYVASEGKFVLSGGRPALTDRLGNSTTGRTLTFFLAGDTVLVDSGGEGKAQSKN